MNRSAPLRVAMLIPDEREERLRRAEPRPWFGIAPTNLLSGLADREDCEVHVVSCVKEPVPACPRLAANIFHHALVVPQWGWLRSGYLGCVLAVRRKVAELGAHVVHGQGAERYTALAAAYSGRPGVVTLHGVFQSLAAVRQARPFSYLWLTAWLEKAAVRRAAGLVCVSGHPERSLAGSARRCWRVPNAVDRESFDVRRQVAVPAVVLCVADLVPHKNQLALVAALAPLAAERKFTLRLAGRAGADPYATAVLRAAADEPWVEYAGFLDRAALREQLALASLLVLPSLEDNCPMVVLEAMAAGVPVAVADRGGMPDLVQDGVTGWVCGVERPEDWRSRLALVLDQPAVALRVADAARQHAHACFRPSVVAEQHLEIYRSVLARGK